MTNTMKPVDIVSQKRPEGIYKLNLAAGRSAAKPSALTFGNRARIVSDSAFTGDYTGLVMATPPLTDKVMICTTALLLIYDIPGSCRFTIGLVAFKMY